MVIDILLLRLVLVFEMEFLRFLLLVKLVLVCPLLYPLDFTTIMSELPFLVRFAMKSVITLSKWSIMLNLLISSLTSIPARSEIYKMEITLLSQFKLATFESLNHTFERTSYTKTRIFFSTLWTLWICWNDAVGLLLIYDNEFKCW